MADAVNRALGESGVAAFPRDAFLARVATGQQQGMRTGLIAILAVALLYTSTAIVNTLVMAVRERRRDLAQLRLASATPARRCKRRSHRRP